VFNFVANFANLKYSYMKEDIQSVQTGCEGALLAMQPTIEQTALAMAKADPQLMTQYLTDYSVSHAEDVVDQWRKLGEFLICKYNDGYVKDENGRPQELGYPEEWRRDVLGLRPDQFILPQWESDHARRRIRALTQSNAHYRIGVFDAQILVSQEWHSRAHGGGRDAGRRLHVLQRRGCSGTVEIHQ